MNNKLYTLLATILLCNGLINAMEPGSLDKVRPAHLRRTVSDSMLLPTARNKPISKQAKEQAPNPSIYAFITAAAKESGPLAQGKIGAIYAHMQQSPEYTDIMSDKPERIKMREDELLETSKALKDSFVREYINSCAPYTLAASLGCCLLSYFCPSAILARDTSLLGFGYWGAQVRERQDKRDRIYNGRIALSLAQRLFDLARNDRKAQEELAEAQEWRKQEELLAKNTSLTKRKITTTPEQETLQSDQDKDQKVQESEEQKYRYSQSRRRLAVNAERKAYMKALGETLKKERGEREERGSYCLQQQGNLMKFVKKDT